MAFATSAAPPSNLYSNQHYFKSMKHYMAFATSANIWLETPESAGVKMQNLVAG